MNGTYWLFKMRVHGSWRFGHAKPKESKKTAREARLCTLNQANLGENKGEYSQ